MHGVLRAPYLSIMPCAPFIQIPPVERVGVGVDGAFAICCVGALVLLGARLTCSPSPLIVAAAVVMLQALVLLIPRFGSPTFWRLHYYARVGSTGYEEWFCTADLAARAVITVPDSANAHVCVVGSGLSALPEVLRALLPADYSSRRVARSYYCYVRKHAASGGSVQTWRTCEASRYRFHRPRV